MLRSTFMNPWFSSAPEGPDYYLDLMITELRQVAREVVREIHSAEFPNIELEHLLAEYLSTSVSITMGASRGKVTIALLGGDDPTAFARLQARSYDPQVAMAEGYRRNNSGSYAEAAAFFDALGEQSARSIRARKTEDVIFSGSEKRRQMGLAEVTLYLDNSDDWMPIELKPAAMKTFRTSGAGPKIYFWSAVKLSGPLSSIFTFAVDRQGVRWMALFMRISNWSQSSSKSWN